MGGRTGMTASGDGAVDAQLDGVRQQARHGYRAPPEVRGCGSGVVLAGHHAHARCHVLEEPSGEAIAAWSADQVGFLAVRLACVLAHPCQVG